MQTKIAELIGLDPTIMKFKSRNMGQFAASRSEFKNFLEGMRKATGDRKLTPERRKAVKSAYLRNFKPEQLQRLLARYYFDALKSPSQLDGPSPRSEPARD